MFYALQWYSLSCHQHRPPDSTVGEYDIHQSMIGGTNILEVEEHQTIIGISLVQHECCLGRIEGIHYYLVVPRIGIYKAQRIVD